MSRSKIEQNLFSKQEEKSYIELTSGGGYFSKFEWISDPYDRFLDQQRLERASKKVMQQEIHGESEFVSHPKVEAIFKHQDAFRSHLWLGGADNSSIGFLADGDPFEANNFEVLRSKWINDAKKLYGDFSAAHGAKDLNNINRKHLPEIVGYIKRRLLADWSDINFIIGTNPEDYIELRFTITSNDAPLGLKAYMSTLINTDDEMIKYRLHRVPQYWGYQPNAKKKKMQSTEEQMFDDLEEQGNPNFVYYMISPPWGNQKNPTLYLQQFPS